MTRQDQLGHVVRTIAAFVWNVHLKRAVAATGPLPEQNFWRVIDGNFMDIAVIEWCKLFASHTEAVHWKNNIPETEHDKFRDGLCGGTGLTSEEWHRYREELKRYRDEHVAHFDLGRFQPGKVTYPHFDKALEACHYYYDRILAELEKVGIQHSFPADIRIYCAKLAACETGIARAAIEATRGIKETAR
jgi:hypothetical protein